MLPNFIYAKYKDLVEDQLNSGNIPEEAVVFIEDSNEIHTHGKNYKCISWSKLTLDVPEGHERFYVDDALFRTADGHFFTKEE